MYSNLLQVSSNLRSLALTPRFLLFFTTNANLKFIEFPLHRRIHFPAKLRRGILTSSGSTQDSCVNATQAFIQQPDACVSLVQECIFHFLHEELGVSLEDSRTIAFNAPKYAEVIVESVRDLEEWNSWKGNGEGFEDGDAGFKEKVVRMIKQKGDCARVAFLESLGLSLSFSMGLARYLSSESLPGLIHKVKYMKEIFFSGSDDEGLVGKYARRMMMHLSIPVDEDVQQTLSFFEKIEARRGGLDMLGSVDASFRFLVESFPHLLLQSVERDLNPVVEYLIGIGVPRECLGKVLLLFPPILLCDSQEIRRRVSALEKVAAANQDVGKMLIKYPWVLSTSIQKNQDQIISYFHAEKVPKATVDRVIRRWPLLLGRCASNLDLMLQQFYDLSVRNKRLGKVIVTSPQLLLKKPQEFLQVVSFLEDLGFNKETVGEILCRCPELFATSIEKTLERKLKFLAGFGISNDHFPRVIKKYPELFVCDTNQTLGPRMEYLMDVGISKRDVAFMVRRFSPLLGYGVDEVLRPKVEFLVKVMEKPVSEVVEYPRYFSYSLEKKIKPRFWLLKGRNITCSLKEMLGKNDEEFAAAFMGPGTLEQ